MRKVPRPQSPPASDVHTAAAAQTEFSQGNPPFSPLTAQQSLPLGSSTLHPQQTGAADQAAPGTAPDTHRLGSPAPNAVPSKIQHLPFDMAQPNDMPAHTADLTDPLAASQQQSPSTARSDNIGDRKDDQQQFLKHDTPHAAKTGTSGQADESMSHIEKQQAVVPQVQAPSQPDASAVAGAVPSILTSSTGGVATEASAGTSPVSK